MTGLRSRLTIGSKIGAGHFGDVHEGMDPIHGRVAVKILTQKPTESAADWVDRREGLLREGERLKRGSHKHVVTVHHILEASSQDAIHLVMEFCSGGSLQGPYAAGPMTSSRVQAIATEVCLGLGVLHSRGMLHRDIKPGNILVQDSGIVKLGDFGLVTDNLILGYGSQAGYSDHIAPEVWRGGGTSVKSDIWALGMTLYRLLHGQHWYDQSVSPRFVVSNGGYSGTLKWLPHVSPKWRRIIKRALNDDTDLRYQNTDQLLNDLGGLRENVPWRCETKPQEVCWTREYKGRSIEVLWTERSSRKHEWTATSSPLAAGRIRRIAGSSQPCGRTQSEKELIGFFKTMP